MSLLTILKYPDPRLNETSRDVEEFGEELKSLAADMAETMIAAPGVGLAAPQVGRLLRLIVVDRSDPEEEGREPKPLFLVNPEIVRADGTQVFKEGCLSVDDLQSEVTRYQEVEVEAQDLDGNVFEVEAEGRMAVILQHEIDHLDGVLFLDRISPLKRSMYAKGIRKRRNKDKDERR
ncbi:MAG: peptide deformylase [Deltaproteobacteria bacterium]|jgi:peptide deformylase|nr:peptide deformylase [Deltaproteobacteria bacterium]